MGLIAPGSAFPDRSLPTLEGRSQTLSEAWKHGPALFAVGHGDCATTRLTLPFVDRIHRRRGQGTTVTAILQEDPNLARLLMADLGLELSACLDEDPYPLAAELGLRTVPTLILVDSTGHVRGVAEGFDRKALQSLAGEMGVPGPLFEHRDHAPALRPG